MIETPPGSWGNCPQGELTKLGSLLAFQRRVRAAVIAGVVLLAAAGVGGAAWAIQSSLQPSTQPESAPCHVPDVPCAVEPATP